jgi:hypothetical protein
MRSSLSYLCYKPFHLKIPIIVYVTVNDGELTRNNMCGIFQNSIEIRHLVEIRLMKGKQQPN